MKTALFGGTFNPIHVGHLHVAETLCKEYGFERIIFVPSHIPPHKNVDSRVDSATRLEMVRNAVEPHGFYVDDCEVSRKGISYTLDTVEHIYETCIVTGTLSMVIGEDLVEGLPSWDRWEELIQKVDLVIARRGTDSPVECPWPHLYLDNVLLPVSSGDIRDRISQGKAFRYLITEPVFDMIEKKALYR
jgi:nicotinate-nucleotide adenylyltransferase